MTIGDVPALIAGVVSVCLSVWALLMGAALLFTGRTAARARSVADARRLSR